MVRRTFPPVHPGLSIRLLEPRAMPAPDLLETVAQALDHPLGTPPFAELAADARSAAIVISDGTRHTHSGRWLPLILERLPASAQVTVVVARGLHAPTPPAALRRLLGAAWGRVPVIQHDCDDPQPAGLGRTSRGTPVEINRLVARADCIVLTGATGYHYYAGYGGGRKALVPGVASRRTIQANHRLLLAPGGGLHPCARTGVLVGNPVHEDMVEAAALARPAFLLTVVNRPDGELAAAFGGDWQAAQQAAVAFLDRHCRRQVPAAYPLVLASAGGEPHDLTLYQAHKAMDAAARLVAPGGVLVLEAGCRQGLGPPEYREALSWASLERLEQRLREGEYCVPVQTAHATLSKTGRLRVILVSRHLPRDDAHLAGMVLCADMGQALELARESLGRLPEEVPTLPAAAGMLVEVVKD